MDGRELTTERGGRLAAVTAVLVPLIYCVFFYPMPNPFDEYLALPIAHALADPGLYSPQDLLITSGMRTPFLLYHAAAWLYRIGADVDLVWYLALVAALAALFATIYYCLRAFASPAAAAIATTLVGCSSAGLGAMNWSWMPARNFVSSTAAFPLLFLAFGLAARRRHGTALAVAAAAAFVHPSFAFMALVACAALAAGDSSELRWRARLLRAIPAVVIFAAAAWYVHSSVPTNITIAPDAVATFDSQFRIFGWHSFVEDYWREGYGWLALQLGLLVAAVRSFDAAQRRTAAILIGALYALAFLWQGYVYIGGFPALTLGMLVRATALAKPLAWGVITAWALARVHGRTGQAKFLSLVGFTILAAGSLTWTPRVAEALAAIACMLLLVAARAPGAAPVGSRPARFRPSFPLAVSLATLAVAVRIYTADPHGWVPAPLQRLTARLHFSNPAGALANLERWAQRGSPRGAMFLVPPADSRFAPFRLRAQRSVYIHADDIPQLAYDITAYPSGYDRFTRAGARPTSQRHVFDGTAYNTLSLSQLGELAREGPTHAVFPRSRSPLNLPVAYADSAWIVFALTPGDSARR